LGWLFEHLEHGGFDGLLFDVEAVFEPDEVVKFHLEVVSLLAAFEELVNVLVVGVLRERKLSAILHKLKELVWLVFAQFL
jgi:hypothetical protein